MSSAPQSAQRLLALTGLTLTLGLVLLHGNQIGERFLGMSPLASRDLFWWPLLAIVLLYILVVERRPLTSIGIRKPTWKTAAYGMGTAALASWAIGPASTYVVDYFHLHTNAGAEQALADTPYWYHVLIVTRAALAEEVVFRGYAIERIQELTGSRPVAGAVSLIAFTLAHLSYWGLAPLIFVASAGFVLTLLYLWRRDLIANIVAHFLTDAMALLL
jgi:membrane protease YdiL (CAAX protease family)